MTNASPHVLKLYDIAVGMEWETKVEDALTDAPGFDATDKCHDWRNHVPDDIENMWAELSDEGKLVAFIFASRAADLEEWD